MKEISRRSFLKGTLAAAAAMGIAGLQPAVFADEEKEEAVQTCRVLNGMTTAIRLILLLVSHTLIGMVTERANLW